MNNRSSMHLTPTITKFEKIFGLIYLPIHVFVLPIVLSVLQVFLFPNMTDIQGNLVYMGFSLAVVLLVYRKMLRREFDPLYDHPFHCLGTLLSGYGLWFVMTFVVASVMTVLGMTEDAPNDAAVDELAKQAYNATMVLSVIVAPILEETLFRGVLFQALCGKNRIVAYVVNVLVFGFIHVWQFALIYWDLSYLLFIIQYIPISFALVWVYDRSGSLWTSIFFHMSNNFIAMKILELL